MAYTAIYDGEERGAWAIPAGEDAYCMECGERMRVWREAIDGTAEHLKHIKNMGGGDGGGTSCRGGESDNHIKWKNFAAERLQEVFGDLAPTDTPATVEERLAAPASDKEHRDADALIYFDPADEQFGRALAVEVQNENKDKDIDAVTEDYVRQGVAVVWLYEDDFNNDGCKLNQVDFRHKAAQSIDSILLDMDVPPCYHTYPEYDVSLKLHTVRNCRNELNREDCEHQLSKREYHVPAKIPNEHFDEAALEIWRSRDWEYWFEPPHTPDYILQAAITPTDSTSYNRVNLPPGYWTDLRKSYWNNKPFEAKLDQPLTQNYILQAAITKTDSTQYNLVELPDDYWTDLRKWYWFNTDFEEKLNPPEEYDFDLDYEIEAKYPADWDYKPQHHHLGEHNADHSCDICNGEATVYVHENGFRCGDCGPWPDQRRQVPHSTV
jgi:hypothetical protein